MFLQAKLGAKRKRRCIFRESVIKPLSIPRVSTMKRPLTKPAIDDYERNVNLSIQLCRWILKPMGVWPRSSKVSVAQRFLHLLINALCYGLLTFLLIPNNLFIILEVKQVYNKIRLCGPSSFCVMAFLKYYLLILRENDIRDCVRRIELDWKNISHHDDRKIMVENAKFGRQLIALCTFFMSSSFIFYYIVIPVSVGKVQAADANLTFIPLLFPFSSLIIDTRYSPTNEIIFFLQLIAGALMHGITSAACGLATMLAVHACGQMEVLMNWLKHLIDGRSDMSDTVDARIASVVNHHVRILKFLQLTEETLQLISLVEFLGCTLNMCLLCYYVIMEWGTNDIMNSVTYIALLISLAFDIFIYCYIGELVAEECSKISEMSYMIDWYRLPGKKKLSVIMIIEMSNLSVKLTAGNIIILSYSKFSDVVKTAVAFLNVLRAVT